MENNFKFNMPVDISLEKAGADKKTVWKIKGYASTSSKDRQDETVIQTGLNIKPFVEHGWFNYDHNNEEILGYPDKNNCRVTPKGLYVEGTLLQSNPLSAKMWNLSQELADSDAPRRLGMSVEGKIKERDQFGRIKRADVYNVALTPNPVNPEATFEAFSKSFSAVEVITPDLPENTPRPEIYDVFGQIKNAVQTPENTESQKIVKDTLYTAFCAIAELAGYDTGREYLKSRLKTESMGIDESVLYLQIITGASRDDALKQIAGIIIQN